MCGRFTRTSPRPILAEEFGVTHFVNVDLNPRYNIAPSQAVEAIVADGSERRMRPMKWGFRITVGNRPETHPDQRPD